MIPSIMRILTVTHYQLPHWGGIEMTAAALHERYGIGWGAQV